MWGLPIAMLVVVVFHYIHSPRLIRGEFKSKRTVVYGIYYLIGEISIFLLSNCFHRIPDGWAKQTIMFTETMFFMHVINVSFIMFFFYLVYGLTLIMKWMAFTKLLRNIFTAFYIAVTVFVLVVSFIGWFQIDKIETSRYSVTVDKAGYEDLRFAVVADLHIGAGSSEKVLVQMVDRINAMDADVVVLCGDVVDGCTSLYDLELMEKYVSQLQSKYGTYYVVGNHDLQCHYDYQAYLDRANVISLVDEKVVLPSGVWLVGREYDSPYRLSALLQKLDWKGEPVMDMIHMPMWLKYFEKDATLTLSGHTHGVQYIATPLVQMPFYKPIHGYKELKPGLHAVTTSGLSAWGYHSKWPSVSEVMQVDVHFSGEAENVTSGTETEIGSMETDEVTSEVTRAEEPADNDKVQAEEPEKNDKVQAEEDLNQQILGSMGFSHELFSKSLDDKNPVESPVSAYLALALTGAGAKGDTKQEFDRVLGQEDLDLCDGLMQKLPGDTDQFVLSLGNSVWVNEDVVPVDSWQKLAEDIFRAETYQTKLSSVATMNAINSWIEENTKGLIKDFVQEPLPEDSAMALFNTVYFHGNWKHPFEAENTHDMPFTLEDGTEITMPMMGKSDAKELYLQGDFCDGVALEYQDTNLLYVALKPEEGMTVREMYEKLSFEDIKDMVDRSEITSMDLRLPKYEVTFDRVLNEDLMDMGLQKAFRGQEADFSGLAVCEDPLYIDLVRQKAVFKLDERGTEAAAVTEVLMRKATAILADKKLEVHFDKPFLYMILDTDTGMPVFVGILETNQS